MFTRPDHLLPDRKKDFFYTDIVFGSKESDVVRIHVHMMPIMGLLFLITACAFLNKMSSLFLSSCFKRLNVFTAVDSSTGMNSCARQAPASYKTPAVLLIYTVKSGKSIRS